MRTTRLIAILTGIAVLAIVAANAQAMYHPGLGRFLQRDPGPGSGGPMRVGTAGLTANGGFAPRDPVGGQYGDGMNLYQYVGSAPVNYVDPLGLWKIKRGGGKFAGAEAEKDDTIEKLAKKIGLGPTEFKEWLTLTSGQMKVAGGVVKNLSSLTATDVCCPGEKVEIPNTVLAYWAGELGGFGKWWVMWGMDVRTLKKRGFNVPEHQGWTARALETEIQTATQAKELHGIFFWGHGYDKTIWSTGGVLTDSSQSGNGAYYSDYGNWNPAYKMGLGVLFACHTQNGRSEFSNSPAVKFWGKTGVLVPHGFHLFGPSIHTLLPPGAQGTKK